MKRDLYQTVTDRIVAKLEAGTVPWVQPWSAGKGSAIPMNAISNRPYSGINVLLYWIGLEAGWPTARFLTFKQAKEAGGHVRKGEHGMALYFYKSLTVKDKASGEDKDIPLLRQYTVFNVAQCDGLPEHVMTGKQALAVKNPDERMAEADQFIVATGADLREGTGKPCYIPSRDFIAMPAFKDFHAAPRFYGVAFHELAHWTGAKGRLDRDFSGRFGDAKYAAEELVAELTAAFLCAEFGFDNEDQSAAYLASWIRLFKDDKRAIFTAASKAQKAANYLRDRALADHEAIADDYREAA